MKKPKISIIVPAYNVEKYIKKCLDSLLNQACDDMEIIVVDDGSTDNTLKIIKDYEKKTKIIKVYHQENKGLAATRKKGIDKALGVYCLNIDADDWLEKGAIKKIEEYLDKYHYVDVLKFRFMYEPSGKISPNYNNANKVLGRSELALLYRDLLLTDKYNNLCNQVFKTKLYDDAYNEDFKRINYGEDLIVNLGLIGKARKVVFVDDAFYHYFENPNSITHGITIKTISKSLSDNLYMYKQRLKYLNSINGDIGVSLEMVKSTLMIAVCDRIKEYMTYGGRVDCDLRTEIEKTGVYAELEDFNPASLSVVNKFISKCVLTKKYGRLKLLKPYVLARKKARKVYHWFLRVKRVMKRIIAPKYCVVLFWVFLLGKGVLVWM